MTNESTLCDVALKEWSVAIRALELGRQIVLIRKGGLLDAEGHFAVEHQRFWLSPTKWHQDAKLLKSEHHDLLQNDTPPSRELLSLRSWAEVAGSWRLDPEDASTIAKLSNLEHIWSSHYIDQRLSYLADKPLFVVALRVHVLDAPHEVESRPEYFGCKSWIDLHESLSTQPSQPAIDDATFAQHLNAIRNTL
jgi:hypothetical protein